MDSVPNKKEAITISGGASPTSLPAVAAAASGASASSSTSTAPTPTTLNRYETQKRRDWNTFGQYLRNRRPPIAVGQCGSAHVLEFLRYMDQFGKTKIHTHLCPFFGNASPPSPCPCPLRQAWGSLDSLIGRLRAAYEEHGGGPEANPFGARAIGLYLREVRDLQAKARGISYAKKKKRNKSQQQLQLQQQQQHQQNPPPPPASSEA